MQKIRFRTAKLEYTCGLCGEEFDKNYPSIAVEDTLSEINHGMPVHFCEDCAKSILDAINEKTHWND